MKKIQNTALATLATASLAAFAHVTYILNYDTPTFDTGDMDVAKCMLFKAEGDYETAQRRAILNSKDTLLLDPTYLKMMDEEYKLYQKMNNGYVTANMLEKYNKLSKDMEILAEALQDEYISKNQAYNKASENLRKINNYIEELKQDSIAVDSVSRMPLKTRYKENLYKSRTDFHNYRIKIHQAKLQKLQNER